MSRSAGVLVLRSKVIPGHAQCSDLKWSRHSRTHHDGVRARWRRCPLAGDAGRLDHGAGAAAPRGCRHAGADRGQRGDACRIAVGGWLERSVTGARRATRLHHGGRSSGATSGRRVPRQPCALDVRGGWARPLLRAARGRQLSSGLVSRVGLHGIEPLGNDRWQHRETERERPQEGAPLVGAGRHPPAARRSSRE